MLRQRRIKILPLLLTSDFLKFSPVFGHNTVDRWLIFLPICFLIRETCVLLGSTSDKSTVRCSWVTPWQLGHPFPVIYCIDFGKKDFFPSFRSIVFGIFLDFGISLIINQVGALSHLFLKNSTHIVLYLSLFQSVLSDSLLDLPL